MIEVEFFGTESPRGFDVMELNKIYCESNVNTMARMPDGFVDLTVTSPPYDNLRVYNDYEWNFGEVANELFRVTKDGGVVVWVVSDKTTDGDESGSSLRQALTFKDIGFKLWDTEIYAKNNPFPGDCGARYKQVWEYMFVFVKGSRPNSFTPLTQPTINPNKISNPVRLQIDGRNELDRGNRPFTVNDTRVRGNIFFYNVGTGETGHPAPFPLELAIDQIYSWSAENDIVYDPFMGSGTTAVAAHKLKHHWIGSEISSEYVDLANKRLEPYLAQSSLF